MTRKARSHDVLGKLSAFSMAVVVLFSIFTPMLSGTTGVDAADASSTLGGSEMFTIHLDSAAASYWSNSMQVRFTDNSGATLATQKITAPAAGGSVTVTAPTSAAGATNIVVENLDTAKAAVKTQIDNLRDTATTEKKVLFLYDNGNSKWSALKYYAYNSDAEAAWPGKDMSQIEGTDLWYASVDRSQYDKLIFNDGAGKQTPSANQPGYSVPQSTSARYCYSSLQSSWVEYTDVLNSVTLSVANRAGNDKNHLYLTGEKTAAWSKYDGEPTQLKTIYFKPTANWPQASVTYDEDDPYSATVQMTIYDNGDPNIPLIFTAQVPVGAKLTFSDGGSHSVSNIIYNGNETLNTYIQSERQWDTLDKALATASKNVDYTVTANNFSTATPSSGQKVVGVNATYFDYLSNKELTSGWRQNLEDGDPDKKGSPYRMQFSTFNNLIRSEASGDAKWRYPLFFGDDYDAQSYIDDYFNALSGSRDPGIAQSNFRAANNANFLDGYDQSVLGLVQNSLSGGNLMVTPNTQAPWFNNDLLRPQTQEPGTPTDTPEAPTDPEPSGGAPTLYQYALGDGDGDVFTTLSPGATITMTWNPESGYYYAKADTSVQQKNGTEYMFCILYGNTTYYNGSPGVYPNSIYIQSGDNVYSGWDNAFKTGYGYSEYYIIFEPTNKVICPVSALGGSGTGGTGGTTTQEDQYAKIIDSYFPFVATTDSNGVTTYSFDSAGAKDNVYFTWDSTSGAPTQVNYGAGSDYGVANKLSGGYGIFPFNNAGDDKRNYGFGIKMEMDFTLPMNGVYESSSSDNHAKFEYTGDDDLWVFIDGQLVLDLGGAHTPSTGSIDFGAGVNTVTSTASSVYAILNAENNSATSGSSGTYSTDIVKNGDPVTNTFTINNTDPTRKHTMTVFYMERGTNDSNLRVSYTIQPVQNDLTVNKEVSIPDINSGIASAVAKAVADSDFGFTLSTKGSAYAEKSYTQTAADGTMSTETTTNTGNFTLKQNYSANFTKDLTYGDLINISESVPSVFSYATYYTVKDNKTDTALPYSPSTEAAAAFNFNLMNKIGTDSNGDSDSGASVTVNYTNTLQTTNLLLSKTLWQQDGETLSTMRDGFTFEVLLDLDGTGEKFTDTAYNLEYQYVDAEGAVLDQTVYTAENGKINLSNGQRVKFLNIPVGAEYKITEEAKSGFELYKVNGTETTNNVAEDTLSNTTDVSISYENKEKPASSRLQAQKTLDGIVYSGGDFTFTAELIRRDGGAAANTGDALKELYNSGNNSVISTVDASGYITFADFSIVATDDKVGKYVFKISENPTDDASLYNYDSTVYYAVIEVTAGKVENPVYYTDEACTTKYTVGSTTDGSTPPTFKNTTKGVDVQFTKVNESGNGMNGVDFEIYTDTNCTQQYTTNAIGGTIGTNGTVISANVDGTDGVVKVEKMAYSTTAPTTYYFKETKTLSGYQLLANPVVVTIATNGTYTVSYNGNVLTDNKVTNNLQPELPIAGGVGVTMFYVLGALAVVIAGTAFVLYKKRINVIALAAHLIHRK